MDLADAEPKWDFSEIPSLYFGDLPEEVVFDPRDHATDYSLRIDQKVDEQLNPREESREVLLRRRLDDLEARRARLTYPKKAKPAVRERISKIRKEVDAEMMAVAKELMIYDVM